jgi:hypothetical protein
MHLETGAKIIKGVAGLQELRIYPSVMNLFLYNYISFSE